MPRPRRNIDMLPLLDVFMVVLFVFATIQEGQLDSSSQDLSDVAQDLSETERELERQRETIAELEQRALQAAELREHELELEDQIVAYQRACGPRGSDDPLCPKAQAEAPDPAEQARYAAEQAREFEVMAALHERLLDNVAVFEVELEGAIDLEAVQLRNRCCVRANPPQGAWQRCGEMPSDPDLRSDWLDDGGDTLMDTLRRTHGGDAIVVLRQGDMARLRLTNDLSEDLRERLPDHEIYDDGLSTAALSCPALLD